MTIHDDPQAGQAVAPGGVWEDGTARLYNTGSGWLIVKGGGGEGLTVLAGGSGYGDYTLGAAAEYAGYQSTASSYSFEVTGLAGGTSGDVTWSGEADSLYVRTSGSVAAIAVNGALSVDAGGSVADLSGSSVWVRAGGTIAAVQASGDVLEVLAGGNISGPVVAAGDVGPVTAGFGSLLAGLPSDGGADAAVPLFTTAPGGIMAAIRAGGRLGPVWASGSITGDITAGSADAEVTVWAAGDVQSVIRGGDVTVEALGTIAGEVYASASAAIWSGRGVSAGVWADGDASVESAGDITGNVNAGEVAWVTAGGSVSSSVYGPLAVAVEAGGDFDGTARSFGSIDLKVSGDIVATVVASGDVIVEALGSVSGGFTAGDDDAWSSVAITAGADVNATLAANQDVTVTAEGGVSGTIAAEGDLLIVAAGVVSAEVTAGWTADVSGLEVSGPISAYGDVYVQALGDTSGRITSEAGEADVNAGGDVTGGVTAAWDVVINAGGNVSGLIRAGDEEKWANAVVRAGGNMSADIRATYAAEVLARRDVTGPVAGVDGYALVSAGGDVSGEVRSEAGWAAVWSGDDVLGAVSALAAGVLASGLLTGEVSSRADDETALALGEEDGLGADVVFASYEDEEAEADGGGIAEGVAEAVSAVGGWLDTADRGGKVAAYLANLPLAEKAQLAAWMANATAEQRANLLNDLMARAKSLGGFTGALSYVMNPPPQDPTPPSAPPPTPSTAPAVTEADLKQWEADARAEQKVRDAVAEAILKEAKDDRDLRDRVARGFLAQADAMRDARERHGFWVFFGWDRHAAAEAKELTLREKATRAWDTVNFEIVDGEPVAITPAGQARQALWKRVEQIGKMTAAEKIGEALQRAIDKGMITGELKKRVQEMIQPANLALMGAAIGVVGTATAVGGPITLSVIGVVGYALFGWSVIDLSRDAYMFAATALGARGDADFDKAAKHFAEGFSKAGMDLGILAGGVIVGRLGKVKNPPKKGADNKVHVDATEAATAPTKPPAGTAAGGLTGALAQLRTKLVEELGESLVKALTKNAEANPALLQEVLDNLDKVVRKAKEWTGSNRSQTLLDTNKKVQALLDDIVKNPNLSHHSLESLISDLARIADLDGFVPAFKRLRQTGEQAKGAVAELQEAARLLREGKEVKAIGKVYDARVEVKTTRGQTKVVQKTDIDLIADGTLWQLKTGPESLSHTWRFEAWLKQAMIVADQTGIKNIGFKFDKDAMAAFNSNGCKALWEHYKNTFKSYNWGNPVLLGTP